MSRVAINGTSLYYETKGTGHPLLLVHGMCGDASVWSDQVRRLSDRHRCVAYDRRGHSRSPLGENVTRSVELHADDAAALIRSLDLAPCTLVASSGGARVGLDVVRRYPDLLSGAVLSEPPVFSLDPEGRPAFPGASKLLVLADGGGSNGWQPRLWKRQVQAQLSDQLGLSVTVCHYPTGCSKLNPIEHRLFGHISLNWAGKPLRTWEAMLAYIQGTKTRTGLEVRAFLQDGVYKTGQSVSDAEMKTLNLERHAICPNWNYTIRPRVTCGLNTETKPSHRVVIS